MLDSGSNGGNSSREAHNEDSPLNMLTFQWLFRISHGQGAGLPNLLGARCEEGTHPRVDG
jgi:hypothetical protein